VTTSTTPPTKQIANPAKRGDLAVLTRTVVDHIIDKPGERRTERRTEAVICVVTAVRRNGVVLRVRDNWGSEREPKPDELVHVMAADQVDVAAAYGAGQKHTWPGYPGQPKAYDSVEAARAALAPFRRAVGA
jgi:hypothetical protein